MMKTFLFFGWLNIVTFYISSPLYIYNNSALCSIKNVKTDCLLDLEEHNFVHEVEELHLSIGIEDDLELLVKSLAEDQLRYFSQYCTCQTEGNITSFCTRILAKERSKKSLLRACGKNISPLKRQS